MEVKVLIKKIFEAAKKVTSKNAEELSQINSVLEFSKVENNLSTLKGYLTYIESIH